MIIYYNSGGESSDLAEIDIDCEVLEQNNKHSKRIVVGVEVLNLSSMVSNQAVNHLKHVVKTGAKMFVGAVSSKNSDKLLSPIDDLCFISGMSCLKGGHSLILITLE